MGVDGMRSVCKSCSGSNPSTTYNVAESFIVSALVHTGIEMCESPVCRPERFTAGVAGGMVV